MPMTDVQLLISGGALVLFIIRQPVIALAWIVLALFVIPDEYLAAVFAGMFFTSLFLKFGGGR